MIARILAALLFDLLYPLVAISIAYFYLGLYAADGRFFLALVAV